MSTNLRVVRASLISATGKEDVVWEEKDRNEAWSGLTISLSTVGSSEWNEASSGVNGTRQGPGRCRWED